MSCVSFITRIVLLYFTLSGESSVRGCDPSTCKGRCIKLRCYTDAKNCNGKACNDDQRCIDGACVDKSTNCGLINNVYYMCRSRGEQCGDGQYCNSFDKCEKDACRAVRMCFSSSVGTCNFGPPGTCSNGACLAKCDKDNKCNHYLCRGGYCAMPKCGESYCF